MPSTSNFLVLIISRRLQLSELHEAPTVFVMCLHNTHGPARREGAVDKIHFWRAPQPYPPRILPTGGAYLPPHGAAERGWGSPAPRLPAGPGEARWRRTVAVRHCMCVFSGTCGSYHFSNGQKAGRGGVFQGAPVVISDPRSTNYSVELEFSSTLSTCFLLTLFVY